ncbi:hypothetical protein DQ04_06611030 [Trypanosoma grayi]|uniref:hypothetical protein n=1 Tax=Trypanosoma grayi TaxID=71804 RepID=UPI0004F479FF|nr:hypothetical protein DQ04_06611030 [Trypanosoma grayi]KEG08704.1 hypothetical protein DQ04_06611030 [Trypanosoma grayi]
MLLHVLCVLALALCCCTSLFVTATGTTDLSSTTVNARLTLEETVDADSCKAPTTSATEGSRKVTISTKALLSHSSGLPKLNDAQSSSSKELDVSVGHNLTLGHKWVVECKKKGNTLSDTYEPCCSGGKCPASAKYITYVLSVVTTVTGYSTKSIIKSEQSYGKVPAGYDVKIVGGAVATCIPTPLTKPPPSKRTALPLKPQNVSPGDKGSKEHAKLPASHSLESDTITRGTGSREPRAQDSQQQSGTTEHNPATNSATSKDEPSDGGKDSSLINKVSTPPLTEEEAKEAESSVTVNDAAHTASTATPQSETTAEEAPKSDVDIPTPAGEGAADNKPPPSTSIVSNGVNLPDRNTDASSSNTAWVRKLLLLLLLLACVALW